MKPPPLKLGGVRAAGPLSPRTERTEESQVRSARSTASRRTSRTGTGTSIHAATPRGQEDVARAWEVLLDARGARPLVVRGLLRFKRLRPGVYEVGRTTCTCFMEEFQ